MHVSKVHVSERPTDGKSTLIRFCFIQFCESFQPNGTDAIEMIQGQPLDFVVLLAMHVGENFFETDGRISNVSR